MMAEDLQAELAESLANVRGLVAILDDTTKSERQGWNKADRSQWREGCEELIKIIHVRFMDITALITQIDCEGFSDHGHHQAPEGVQ